MRTQISFQKSLTGNNFFARVSNALSSTTSEHIYPFLCRQRFYRFFREKVSLKIIRIKNNFVNKAQIWIIKITQINLNNPNTKTDVTHALKKWFIFLFLLITAEFKNLNSNTFRIKQIEIVYVTKSLMQVTCWDIRDKKLHCRVSYSRANILSWKCL